jgi:nitroreductase
MSLLNDLHWRYATKRYDSSKKVSQDALDKIIEAARLAPTSSGLQQFRVLVISNQELKEKIMSIANAQPLVGECSHLLVFASWDNYTTERIDGMYNYITDERGLPRGRFVNYTDRLKSKYLPQSPDENFVHTARQAYIGMAMAMAQAAELKIDSTPMEGFSNVELDDLLNLKSLGLKSVTLLPLGYRDTERDWLTSMKKVRIPKEDFVIEFK